MRTVLRKLGWFRAVIGCEVVLYGRRDCRSGVFLSSVVFHWNRGCLGREDDGGQEEKYWCSCMPLLIAGSPSGFCLLLLLVAGGSAPGGALVLVRVGLKYRPCSDASFALHHMSYQALWSSLCPKPITKPQSMPRSTQWLDRSCTNFPSLMLQLLATPS